MDKIWYRNPSKSEVIVVVAGMKKKMTTQNRQKSNVKKKESQKANFSLGDDFTRKHYWLNMRVVLLAELALRFIF